jgi:hypothetical protein
MEQEVAFGRCIRQRATGRVVGPVVPVYRSDIPYGIPSLYQVVWRYLPLWKFEDMCTSSTLYFCRCDKLDDQLEGRPSRRGIHGTSRSDLAFADAYPMSGCYQNKADAQDVTRYTTFLNCWHKNSREDNRMWKEYTKGDPDSVVITSSVKALYRVASPKVQISNVKYISEDFPRTSLGSMSLFFSKTVHLAMRGSYEWLFMRKASIWINKKTLDAELK